MDEANNNAQSLFGASAEPSAPATGTTSTPPSNVGSSEPPGSSIAPAATHVGESSNAASAVPPATTSNAPSGAVPPTGFTPEMVKEIVKSAVSETRPQEAPKQWTQEEFDKTFNVMRVNPKHLEMLAQGGDAALQAHNEMIQGAVRQAVTMAQALYQNQHAQLQQQLNPYMQFANQMRENAYRNEFYETNKDLAGFEPLVEDVKGRLEREGFKGSKEQVFKRLAEETRKVLSVVQKPGATGNVSQTQANTTTKMTPLSGGGQGGAGSSNTTSAGGGSSTAKSIFG